jgi:hypothetical protein
MNDSTATRLSRRLRHRAERLDLPTDPPIHAAADEFDAITSRYFDQPPAATVGDFLAARERARSFLNR